MTYPSPRGAEFPVNSTTQGAQMAPATAALANGGFVAVWIDGSGSRDMVRGQVFDAEGAPVGQEFAVSGASGNNQAMPRVAGLADGRFVVAWGDRSEVPGFSFGDIRAQVYLSDGTPQGDSFIVNATTLRDQTLPDITALEGGGFVVTWLDGSLTVTPTGPAARAQVFAADAAPVGAEILAHGEVPVGEAGNAVLGLADGGFLMLWQGRSLNGSLSGQVYSAEGAPQGASFTVNQTTQGMQGEPAMAALSGGRFVVAWTDGSRTGGDTSGTAIRAQVFDPSGGRIGPEQLVNTQVTEGDQRAPAIGVLEDGRFVIAWQSQGESMAFAGEIRAQLFNANGTRSGTEFAINPASGDAKSMPSVVGLEGGRFAVVWDDFVGPGSSLDNLTVRGQVFDAGGGGAETGGPITGEPGSGGPGAGDTGTGGTGTGTLPWSSFAREPTHGSVVSDGTGQQGANGGAFAALREDGSVLTWGSGPSGADSSTVADALGSDVVSIHSTSSAFAALKADGSVVTWGGMPGYPSETLRALVSDDLSGGVVSLFSSNNRFAALKDDGSVVSWGDSGDRFVVHVPPLDDAGSQRVVDLFAIPYDFLALRADGTVKALDDSFEENASMEAVLNQGFISLHSTQNELSALRADGSVLTWVGTSRRMEVIEGDFVSVVENGEWFAGLTPSGEVRVWGWHPATTLGDAASELQGGVVKLVAGNRAFAALKDDGSVISWGAADTGGNQDRVAEQLRGGVVEVFGAELGFMALKEDGSVVAWGDPRYGDGSVSDEMQERIAQGIVDVRSNRSGFALLTSEGAVATVGFGNQFDLDNLQSDVVALYANRLSFAALKADGAIVPFGPGVGGFGLINIGNPPNVVSMSVTDELAAGGFVGMASPFGTPFETGLGRHTGGVPGVTDPEPEPTPPPPPPADLPDPASLQVLQAGDLLLITDQPWTPQGRGHASAEGAEVTVRHAESGALLMTLIGQTRVNPDTLVFDGTVISAAPTIAEPVMVGSFTLDLDRLQTTALTDAGDADTFAFGTDAVALDISAIRLQPFSALFAADLSLDPVLPGISTRNSPFFLRTDEIGYFLEPTGAGMRFLEDDPFTVSFPGGAGLKFSLSDVWFFYDNFERAMYLGGKGEAKWSGEVSGANFADLNPRRTNHKIELDLRGELEAEESILGTRGDKFIRIALQGDGLMDRLDWAGSLKYTAMPSLIRETGVLFVREAKLDWNTIEQTIGGSAKVELSFLKGVTAEAAVTLQYDPLALQALSVGLDNLNLPIGATGFFVQGGSVGLDNIASRATTDDVLELTGTLKLSFGPSVIGLRPPVEITVTGSYSSNEAALGLEVKKTAGALLPERVAGTLVRTGESNHPLVQSLTKEFSVKPDELLDYEILNLTATITMNYAANHTTITGTAAVLNGALFATAQAVIWAGDNGGTSYQVTFNWGIEVPARVPILGGSRAGIVVGARGGDTAGYVEAYGYVDASVFGIGRGQQALGFRLHNDGRFEEINARNLPKINSWELAPSQDVVVMSARWEHAAPDAELVVITPDGTRLRESDLAAHDNIAILDDFSSDTLRTVAVSRPEAGIWDIELVSADVTGEVIYQARELLQGAEGTIQRVVQNTATERLTVTYDLTLGDAEAATLGFQFAQRADAMIGVELLSLTALEGGQGLVAEIDLTALMPGEYWLLMRSEGLGSAPQITTHDSPIVVTGAADLAVQSEYRWNEATATKSAVFTVSNEGTRLSGQSRLELEVPETLIGGALTGDLIEHALGQLAPGESVELTYELGRASVDPESRLVARVTSTGHDADIDNNTDALTPLRVTGDDTVQAWVSYALPDDLARLELQGGAALDGTGHAGDNVLVGNDGDNRLEGSGGDNLFFGGGGDDTLIGGAGQDIAVYRGARESYEIHTDRTTGITTVIDLRDAATTPDHDGTDTLTNIETLRFADMDVILAMETMLTVSDRSGTGMGGVTLRMYQGDEASREIGISDESGQVFFVSDASGEIRIMGSKAYDPTADGTITPSDALDVLRLAVGLSPSWGSAAPKDYIAADINQDGQVTALDALDVLRTAVGLQTANQPRWFFMDSDADLGQIDRNNTLVDEGIVFDPAVTDMSALSMTGVLLGNMQEHAQ